MNVLWWHEECFNKTVKSSYVLISDDCVWGRAFSYCEWLVLIINLIDSRVTWEMNPWMIILVMLTDGKLQVHQLPKVPTMVLSHVALPLGSQKELRVYTVPVASSAAQSFRTAVWQSLWYSSWGLIFTSQCSGILRMLLSFWLIFHPPTSSRPGTAFSPRELWNDW